MINILRGDGHNHYGKYIIIDMHITKNKMLCCAHLSYYIFPSYGGLGLMQINLLRIFFMLHF